ncbi:MAG: hypothetical protein AB7O92_34190 [Acidimicrobiia bacterium]
MPTLAQKAGVPVERLPRVVLKELVDNAHDAMDALPTGEEGGGVRWGLLAGENGFFVEDDGGGLGGPAEVAELFSVNRPLCSSKLLRLPTRGALGNGLRVVAGAVLATGGSLVVSTGGRRLRLVPRDSDGKTAAEVLGEWGRVGTRVEVRLGGSLRVKQRDLDLARRADLLACGVRYKGRTSAFWFDADSFYELCGAAGGRSVRELVSSFDGCTGRKAGALAAGRPRRASMLTRAEAEQLLSELRHASKEVRPHRLGHVGNANARLPRAYKRLAGSFSRRPGRGRVRAELPYVLEAWAELADDGDERPEVLVSVNRSPVVADVRARHEKTGLVVHGCGLGHRIEVGRRPVHVWLNLTTPYMPITSDGKEPDLTPFLDVIYRAVEVVARRAKRHARDDASPRSQSETKKGVILASLEEAASKASGDGEYRFSLRQLFYAVRPYVLDELQEEPSYDYFSQVVTDYEGERGDIPGMYRDNRGVVYHPHLRREIPLGTRTVEDYERPAWTFNKILYCEKAGFFPILCAAAWPERHDCALLTSKGFASRAARDLLDLLGDTDEELTFFCIHDADASGTLIYQALQEGTRARPRRQVNVVNLGLEPREGLAMGLPAERASRAGKKRLPVADYVDAEMTEWLQGNRIELNAMTTPQFLAWLDEKLEEHGQGKLVPPQRVLAARLEDDVRGLVRQNLTERILQQARLDEQAEAAFAALRAEVAERAARAEELVRAALEERPEEHWSAPVGRIAEDLARPS